jgi:hypothetical protein
MELKLCPKNNTAYQEKEKIDPSIQHPKNIYRKKHKEYINYIQENILSYSQSDKNPLNTYTVPHLTENIVLFYFLVHITLGFKGYMMTRHILISYR